MTAHKEFYAEHPQGRPAEPFEDDLTVKPGSRYSLGEMNVTITSPAKSYIVTNKSAGTNFPILSRLPFHLGFIEDTAGIFKVVIRPDLVYSDETDIVVLDVLLDNANFEHYVIIGYKALDEISGKLLDLLGIDTTESRINVYHSDLKTITGWVLREDEDHGKPFTGGVACRDKSFISTPAGCVPICYSFINGRKVYKASILGAITPTTESWRQLCDTITFMNDDEVTILYISSGGGDTQTASSLIAAMSQTLGTVVTVACGACASAAPVIWSKGHIRLMTSNASMMVHNMAIADPSTKTTSHLVDLGEFTSNVAYLFLKRTVGAVGLATNEEIDTVIRTSREYYHSAETVLKRTGATLVSSDKDIWKAIDNEKR